MGGCAQPAHGLVMRHHSSGLHILQAALDALDDFELALDKGSDSFTSEIGVRAARLLGESPQLILDLGWKSNR